MSRLRDTDSTTLKNVSIQFWTSWQKIFTKKIKSHTLSKMMPMERVIKKLLRRLGTNTSTEMRASSVIFSMVNSSQLLSVLSATEFLSPLTPSWWPQCQSQAPNGFQSLATSSSTTSIHKVKEHIAIRSLKLRSRRMTKFTTWDKRLKKSMVFPAPNTLSHGFVIWSLFKYSTIKCKSASLNTELELCCSSKFLKNSNQCYHQSSKSINLIITTVLKQTG